MKQRLHDLRGGLWIAGTLAWLFAFAVGAAADVIVLSSSAQDIYARTELSDNYVLKLKAGEEVNLLLPNDATKRIPGPFEGTVSSLYKNDGVVRIVYKTMKALWFSAGRDSTGATGTRDTQPVGDADWRAIQVVARTGGPATYCVEKGSQPLLSRAPSMNGVTVRITDAKKQTKPAELNWPRDKNELEWPKTMPVQRGRIYSVANSGVEVQVTLLEVQPGSLADSGRLKMLAKHKCTVQLEAWLDQNG